MVGELEGAGSVNVLTIIRGGMVGDLKNIIIRVGTPTGDEIGHIIIILGGGVGVTGYPPPRALKQNIIII